MGNQTYTVKQEFAVRYTYPVAFTDGLFDPDNHLLRDTLCTHETDRRHRVFVCVDSGVADAWPDLETQIHRYARSNQDVMELVGRLFIVPGGEQCKNDPALVDALHARFAAIGLDRQSFVLVIGGGAVVDMVGYAAATCHRGIRLLRAPTTVLAQNDAAVGVKNSINAFGSKNFLGTFVPPFAVLCDHRFIDTLEERDKRAGMAEAIKVALIRDRAFFWWIVEHAAELARFEGPAMAYMIRRCAELHLDHIATSGDPFEYGSARPLDFGHWAAHKLEVLTDHALRHGEAVAIGIALDTCYSTECGLLDPASADTICHLIHELGFECTHDLLTEVGHDGKLVVFAGLEEFRQHLGGRLTVTLLAEIGRGVEVHEIREDVLMRALRRLTHRCTAA